MMMAEAKEQEETTAARNPFQASKEDLEDLGNHCNASERKIEKMSEDNKADQQNNLSLDKQLSEMKIESADTEKLMKPTLEKVQEQEQTIHKLEVKLQEAFKKIDSIRESYEKKLKEKEQGKEQMHKELSLLQAQVKKLEAKLEEAIPVARPDREYGPAPPVSAKHETFLLKDINDSTPATEIPGIGPAAARNLSLHGIKSAFQILHYYSDNKFDREKTMQWMKSNGMPTQYWVLAAMRGIEEYYKQSQEGRSPPPSS